MKSTANVKLTICNKPLYSSGIDNRTEILRLRRRFIKDQEKLSLIYARKGIAEQKREKVCIYFENLSGQKYFFYINGYILRK